MTTKKEMVLLEQYRDKFKYKQIPVDRCTTGEFQVRNKNMGVGISELENSMESVGLLQPIGVARSSVTNGSKDLDWEIVWGQRRHYAATVLGWETIPAMVLDEELTVETGKTLGLVENIIRVNMQTREIWNAIEEIYLTFGDPEKCARSTGIPLPLVRDAIKTEMVKNLKGGEKMFKYAQMKKLHKSLSLDILNICRQKDGITVNQKKAEQFIDYIAAQDNELRANTMKFAKQNPGATVAKWKEGGKDWKKTAPRSRRLAFPPHIDDALVFSSEQEGMSPEENAQNIITEKLTSDGFL